MQPLLPNHRSPIIDALRGWALLGVTMGNYAFFYYLNLEPNETKDTLASVLENVMHYFFWAKSWTLLSILFGYGFSGLMTNIARTTDKPAIFFLKRMTWLLAFAFVNAFFFVGDILHDYALLGVILILFSHLEVKTIFRISLVLLLFLPFVSAYIHSLNISYVSEANKLIPLFYSDHWLDIFQYNLTYSFFTLIIEPSYFVTVHLVMFLCMLLGMSAHRTDFFQRIEMDRILIKRIFWISFPLAIGLYALLLFIDEQVAIFNYFRFGYWAILSATVAISSGICWLRISGQLKTLFRYLGYMGRMTLTHYITHCFLSALLFSGVGLSISNMPYWFYLIVAISIYTIQLFLSKWWLTNFQHGPAEWLWRKLTYGNLRKKEPVDLDISN